MGRGEDCTEQTTEVTIERSSVWASLVAQWLRIRLPMQGHRFKPWSGKIPHAAEQLGP